MLQNKAKASTKKSTDASEQNTYTGGAARQARSNFTGSNSIQGLHGEQQHRAGVHTLNHSVDHVNLVHASQHNPVNFQSGEIIRQPSINK